MVIAQSETFEVVEGDDNAPEYIIYLRLSELRGKLNTQYAWGRVAGLSPEFERPSARNRSTTDRTFGA